MSESCIGKRRHIEGLCDWSSGAQAAAKAHGTDGCSIYMALADLHHRTLPAASAFEALSGQVLVYVAWLNSSGFASDGESCPQAI